MPAPQVNMHASLIIFTCQNYHHIHYTIPMNLQNPLNKRLCPLGQYIHIHSLFNQRTSKYHPLYTKPSSPVQPSHFRTPTASPNRTTRPNPTPRASLAQHFEGTNEPKKQGKQAVSPSKQEREREHFRHCSFSILTNPNTNVMSSAPTEPTANLTDAARRLLAARQNLNPDQHPGSSSSSSQNQNAATSGNPFLEMEPSVSAITAEDNGFVIPPDPPTVKRQIEQLVSQNEEDNLDLKFNGTKGRSCFGFGFVSFGFAMFLLLLYDYITTAILFLVCFS